MNILAIDTTGNVASVAVVDEYKTIGEYTTNYKLTHSQTILPIVSALLDRVQKDLSRDIDYIACACGPGSFTGLRIGAATAKALAHGANKPIVPVPTLDALAYNVLDSGRVIAPIMDARRGQVYTALYECGASGVVRLTAYLAEDFTQLLNRVQQEGRQAIFTGDGVLIYGEAIASAGHLVAPPHLNMQRAAAVASLALRLVSGPGQSAAVPYDAFELIYLRKPQAERELEERKQADDRNSAL